MYVSVGMTMTMRVFMAMRVFVVMVKFHVKRNSGESPLAFLFYRNAITVKRNRSERRTQLGFVAAEIQQRSDGHVARDAARTFKVETCQ